MGLVAKADNDRVITYEQLPQPAKDMIKAHFASKVPMIITADFDDFEVFFESGEKIEFDIQGSWKEISCKRTFVPDALIPDMVKAGVKKSFPEAAIIKIERDRRGYEVRLNNGFEVEDIILLNGCCSAWLLGCCLQSKLRQKRATTSLIYQ